MATKLAKILDEKKLTQGELCRRIYDKSGFKIGRDRISRYVNYGIKNVSLETATMIAEALEVTVNDINELKDVKKENKV